MADITPELLEAIRNDYSRRVGTSATVRALSKKIKNETATYSDAMRYAKEIGNIRAKVLKNNLSSSMLPDGRMYYNIANEVVNDSLKTDYKTIQPICTVAQKNKNKKMGLGVKAKDEEIDQDNIDGIINMICSDENYDNHSLLFEMACATFAKHVVDRNLQCNAQLHKSMGLKVKIVRIADANCCHWCTDMSGSYNIGSAPDDVWGRHNDCNCSIDYESK